MWSKVHLGSMGQVRERTGRAKLRKTHLIVGRDWNSSINEGKARKNHSYKKAITLRSRQVPSQCLDSIQTWEVCPTTFNYAHDVIWHGTTLWSAQDSCSVSTPSLLLVGDRVKDRESLGTVQVLLSSSSNITVWTPAFQSQIKTTGAQRLLRRKLTPSPPEQAQWVKALWSKNLILVFVPACQGVICYGVWSCCLLSKSK